MFTYTTQLRILFKSRNLSFPQYIGTLCLHPRPALSTPLVLKFCTVRSTIVLTYFDRSMFICISFDSLHWSISNISFPPLFRYSTLTIIRFIINQPTPPCLDLGRGGGRGADRGPCSPPPIMIIHMI